MIKYITAFLTIFLSATFFSAKTAAAAPANDGFANAATVVLNGDSVVVTASNAEATKETGEPAHADNAGGKSVWFNFTPTETVVARINITQTGFDTLLAVYTGASVNNLTLIGSNDDCSSLCGGASTVDLVFTAGQTYRIAVDGKNNGSGAGSGSFNLNILTYPVPFNDNLNLAYTLGNQSRGSIAGTTFNGTREPDEPSHYLTNPTGSSVWYKWTPTVNASMDFEFTSENPVQCGAYSSTISSPDYNQLASADLNSVNFSYNGKFCRLTFFAETGKTYFIAAENSPGAERGNYQLRFQPHKLGYSANFDFFRTTMASLGVFRPSDGNWYVLPTINALNQPRTINFGLNGDDVVPADFDGDGTTDYAVARTENGKKICYITKNGYGFEAFQWGAAGDKMLTGDFDRDGRADLVAVRQTALGLAWYVRQSSNGFARYFSFGVNSDNPVIGDFDGDGATEISVTRNTPSGLVWYILKSNFGQGQMYTQLLSHQFGISSDIATPADFDGDGKTDVAVFRPSNGYWYVLRSSDGLLDYKSFGQNGDVPQPADYDGDGRGDIAVFRPSNGNWFILRSSNNQLKTVNWGASTDRLVTAPNVPQ